MAKRWFAYSGILQSVLSQETLVTGTQWQVVHFGVVLETFSTLSDAEDYLTSIGKVPGSGPFDHQIKSVETTLTQPAQSKGIAVVPITPLPLHTRPGTVLTTRGFWDVRSTTHPAGVVSNFAFGMIFLPVSVVYDRQPVPKHEFAEQLTLRESPDVPDPLLDDPGWFAYDSFVRVTTQQISQDPPFHSKSMRNFPANSVLCVVAGVEVVVANLTSLRLDFGIRFRILIDS